MRVCLDSRERERERVSREEKKEPRGKCTNTRTGTNAVVLLLELLYCGFRAKQICCLLFLLSLFLFLDANLKTWFWLGPL